MFFLRKAGNHSVNWTTWGLESKNFAKSLRNEGYYKKNNRLVSPFEFVVPFITKSPINNMGLQKIGVRMDLIKMREGAREMAFYAKQIYMR